MQRPTAKRHLSGLQRSLLQWLYAEQHRHRHTAEAGGIPYAGIVRAVAADKLSVTTSLRQLMRKGLVLIILPRGGWSRCVILTEHGKAYAKTLAQEDRKFRPKLLTDDITAPGEYARRQRGSARRRERERTEQQKKSGRRFWRRER